MKPPRPISPGRPEPDLLREAAAVLRAGGLVVVPTETVYGVAADPFNPAALAALFEAKGRSPGKPVARLVASVADVERCTGPLRGAALALARRWWPGPLTLVLDTPDGAVGFRLPDHPVAVGLVRAFGGPVAATSANRSGEPDARTAAEAQAAMGGSVALVLDAGPAGGGTPSAVVRVTAGGVSVLRAGALSAADLLAVAEADGR